MNFDFAIKTHRQWKLNFSDAIKNKKQLNIKVIAADNQCEFGKWLYGEGKKYEIFSSYKTCITEHAHFHKCAGNVAKMINTGRYVEAEKMIEQGTDYFEASYAIYNSIVGFQIELGITENLEEVEIELDFQQIEFLEETAQTSEI